MITALTGITAIAVAVLLLQLLTRKLKVAPDEDNRYNRSYSIWVCSLLLSLVLLFNTAVKLLSNAFEVILADKSIKEPLFPIVEKISVFIGFSFLWFVALLVIANLLSRMVFGKRNDRIEIERDNYIYFIIKGMLLFLLVFTMTSVFENFLRLFMPVMETPFYH